MQVCGYVTCQVQYTSRGRTSFDVLAFFLCYVHVWILIGSSMFSCGSTLIIFSLYDMDLAVIVLILIFG